MGSTTPSLNPTSSEAHSEDDLVDRPAPTDARVESLLLRRIADALQVPPSALYGLSNIGSGSRADVDTVAPDSYVESECAALLLAYRRISDPAERQRLLSLVQAAAERS